MENRNSSEAGRYEWKPIGEFGCHGVLDAHPDPKNPDKYIITWQLYAIRPTDGTPPSKEKMRFSIYDAKTKTFTPQRKVFAPGDVAITQGHPCWGYSHGKYRTFFCRANGEGRFLAEAVANEWSDFQEYVMSGDEPLVTPDIGEAPMSAFLAVDDSTAWLFYEITPAEYSAADTGREEPNGLAYSVFRKEKGWDGIRHDIPTGALVASGTHIMGTPMKEGDDVVIYSSVGMGEKTGSAYRFKTADNGKTWTAEQLTVEGMADPFKRDIDTQLFVTVVRKGGAYYLCGQSHASHRWLARGADGIHFKVVADFGQRRSLSNTMVDIKGTKDLLLVYADYPDPNLNKTCTPGIKKTVEYLIYDTAK